MVFLLGLCDLQVEAVADPNFLVFDALEYDLGGFILGFVDCF